MALQLSTAIGLAVTTAITTTVTVNQSRDALPSPDTLLAAYRVAGWICVSAAVIGIPLNFYSLRGVGIIGAAGVSKADDEKKTTTTADNLNGSSIEIGAMTDKRGEV